MALNKSELITLAKITANADNNSKIAYSFGEEKFSCADLNETLRNEMNAIAGTYALYRENKNLVFELIEEVINETLPKRVMEQYGQFADVKTFAQGDKPVFKQKITSASRRRAKSFITKVGLAGIYEVFKLDGASFEVTTSAFGGAAQIGIEEFLDGRVDFADLLEIVMEGLDEAVYNEIASSLQGLMTATVNGLPAANKDTETAFTESEFDKLISISDSYGKATIYCTYEFAATMVPSTGWISESMKDQKWSNGYIANYKGHNVVVLAQSYTDETNAVKAIDPGYCYIIPTGAEKPVKIALEGTAVVKENDNADWSKEIQVYKKFGVATIANNGICIYKNSSL